MIYDIPAESWRQLRMRAIREGLTIKQLFLRWIQRYADGATK